MDYKMVGKNTLIISPEEMIRAINKYFKDLVGVLERENAVVVKVRQKGAPQINPFIIEIEEKEPKRQ